MQRLFQVLPWWFIAKPETPLPNAFLINYFHLQLRLFGLARLLYCPYAVFAYVVLNLPNFTSKARRIWKMYYTPVLGDHEIDITRFFYFYLS